MVSTGRLLFAEKNGDISILVEPFKFGKGENVFINIPKSYENFEIYTNNRDPELSNSKLLKEKPKSTVDKIARSIFSDSKAISNNDNGVTIVFPPGLELTSFAPMDVFCVQINKEEFEPIAEHIRKRPDDLENSVLGRELIKLSKV